MQLNKAHEYDHDKMLLRYKISGHNMGITKDIYMGGPKNSQNRYKKFI